MEVAKYRFLSARTWPLAAVLVLCTLVAYQPVWEAGFVWDDESHLTQNPCIVGPLGLKEIWTTARAVYYPLTLTSFWVLHKFVGLSSSPYHFLNLFLHASSALLFWRVLRQLEIRGAWLGAALWALHPVMVQSVAWVTELKNTQSCLFYLLSIFWFLKVDAEKTGDRIVSWRFGWALLFFILAIMSKPSTVMLPAVLVLCVWWKRDRIRRSDSVRLVPFALISVLAGVWTIWEQKFHSGASGPEWALTWPERLIIAGRAVWFYLAKLAWPDPLIFIYQRWEIHPSHLTAYLPLLAAVAGLGALWLIRSKWSRPVFFAAAYFVISLFPVLGFFNIYFFRYSFVSDHFQYLASMAPLALAGAGITRGIASLKWKPFVRLAGCAMLLFLLGFLSFRQSTIYRDLVTLYTATLAANPSCWMAHYNLGIALRARGETDQAITQYRRAIALRPDYAEAHYNLGRLLVEKGEFDDAIASYEKALAINPADAEANNNLGAALFDSGRVDDAISHYQEALSIRPDYADASCNLANALLSKGDIEGAIIRYTTCVTLSPSQADAQYNLASALLRTGRTDEAIIHYQKTLELRPDNADAHANLGSALLKQGRAQDAIAQYRDALKIAPDNVAAESNLAWLLATSGDASIRNGAEAVVLAERASRLSGGNRPIILRILAATYAEAGRFAEALTTAQEALQLAGDQDNRVLVDALRKEIDLYQLRFPYHKQSQ